ncbi:hypothetical protein AB0O42_29480 [Streptomyces sp. NPDC089922]|uniref:hypothetical protein n=1 Tax=Streptomyces sp. NPDC089922 TaxID=3155189 RepID=UPI003424818D
MAFQTLTLSVLIASPGDTSADRDVVENAIRSFNSDHTLQRKIHLLPLRWELGAVPVIGERDAQQVINEQLVDMADIVIAVFNNRLGQATKRAVSGTAEEILRARERGAPVHVFFSEAPIPRDHDRDQLEALNEFREELMALGLMGSYASPDDLAAKVRRCLEYDAYNVGDLGQAQSSETSGGPGAVLRSSYHYETETTTDSRGRSRSTRKRHLLRVENLGTEAAENVSLEISPVGEGENPLLLQDAIAGRIPAQAKVDFSIMMHAGVASQGTVVHRWTEAGESYSEEQTISWL